MKSAVGVPDDAEELEESIRNARRDHDERIQVITELIRV